MNLSEVIGSIELLLLLLTLMATVVISAFVAWQTHRHFSLQRTQDFSQRFNSVEIINARDRVDQWIARSEPAWAATGDFESKENEAVDEAGFNAGLRGDIRAIANFFQELGAALRFRTVDRPYTWAIFGGLTRKYWQALSPYVHYRRYTDERPTLFEDFEWLAETMHQIDVEKGTVKAKRTKQPQVYMFGYGSLFSPESIAKTAGSGYAMTDLIPVWLHGYQRDWAVYDHVVFDADEGEDRTTPTAFYNIQAEFGKKTNGVLIPIHEDDLPKFDQRERHYDRVDVTNEIVPRPTGRVYAYVGKAQYAEVPEGTVIASRYEDLVETALKTWGPRIHQDFAATTVNSDLPRRDGAYRFTSHAV